MRGAVKLYGNVQGRTIIDLTRWAVALRPAYSPSGYAEIIATTQTKAEAEAVRKEVVAKNVTALTRTALTNMRVRYVLLRRDAGEVTWREA